jgi:predicted nucleic acid-binding protein
MSYLVDTNVLLRLVQQNHPMHADALRALVLLRNQGAELCLSSQNLIEFWAVATRPLAHNGLGLTGHEASQEMQRLKKLFKLRADVPAIFLEWEKLVAQHQMLGKQTHDA